MGRDRERKRELWGLDGLWDQSAMLLGIERGQPDPFVPDDLAAKGWRAVIDAEGEVICLAPPVGPDGREDWPELLAEWLAVSDE